MSVCVLPLYRPDEANRDLYFLQSLKGGLLVLSESHTHTHARTHTQTHTQTHTTQQNARSQTNLAMETAERHGSMVILANDPDTDRLTNHKQ